MPGNSFHYYPVFVAGDHVQIAERETLKSFSRPAFQGPHPITTAQLSRAGSSARVDLVVCWMGGQVVYRLEGFPELWHEDCLEDPSIEYLRSFEEYRDAPLAADHFQIEAVEKEGEPYVLVKNKLGMTCLLIHYGIRYGLNEELAEFMRSASTRRSVMGFESRHGFSGGVEPSTKS